MKKLKTEGKYKHFILHETERKNIFNSALEFVNYCTECRA